MMDFTWLAGVPTTLAPNLKTIHHIAAMIQRNIIDSRTRKEGISDVINTDQIETVNGNEIATAKTRKTARRKRKFV